MLLFSFDSSSLETPPENFASRYCGHSPTVSAAQKFPKFAPQPWSLVFYCATAKFKTLRELRNSRIPKQNPELLKRIP
nr:hypothetical protein [uncultured Campylobacter sp.]